jgi:hypothetical protein
MTSAVFGRSMGRNAAAREKVSEAVPGDDTPLFSTVYSTGRGRKICSHPIRETPYYDES